MSIEVNRKNIRTLMAHVEDMVAEIEVLQERLQTASRSVGTLDGKVTNLHNLVYTALVQVKGSGSTEPENAD